MSDKPFVISRRVLFVASLLVVLMTAAAALWAGKSRNSRGLDNASAGLQAQLDVLSAQYRHDVKSLTSARDALQSQLLVEQTTRATLETSLQKAQAELADTRERLAFYEQLLPPGPAGSVTIRAFDLEARQGLLAYRVLLMRNGSPGNTFNGLMEFVANGVKNGKNVKIALNAAVASDQVTAGSAETVKKAMQLSFDQFQRAEGLLDVPSGLVVQSVTLNITEGATVRATSTAGVVVPESAASTH